MDDYDRYVSSDLTQLDKTFIRIETRRGPKGTGLIDAGPWIDVPPNMAHILKQRFEVMAMEARDK